MPKLVCIVCPRGCTMEVTETGEGFRVTGNTCKRGEAFALAEMTCPMRTISSTVPTVFPEVPVLPVRVSAEIPKERIFDVMREIKKVRLDHDVRRGDVVLADDLGLGVDIIATDELLKRK